MYTAFKVGLYKYCISALGIKPMTLTINVLLFEIQCGKLLLFQFQNFIIYAFGKRFYSKRSTWYSKYRFDQLMHSLGIKPIAIICFQEKT